MRRLWSTAVLILLAAGCHAPTPSMNSFIPYGKATVPAPATGSVGVSTDYYSNPDAGNATGATGLSSPTPADAGAVPNQLVGSLPEAGVDRSVVPASYTPGTTAGTSLSSLRAAPSGNASTLKLGGMPVNDATTIPTTPSASTTEPVNLTQLPDASNAPSLMRILSPGPIPARVPTPATPATGSTNTAAGAAWQSR